MNNIFAIRKDIPAYQILDLDILDVTRNLPESIDLDSVYDFSLLNTSMIEWWGKPDTKFSSATSNTNALIPDISCWVDATLVLSPKANRLLRDSLKDYGEFLPAQIGHDTYYIFNCQTFAKEAENMCTFNMEEGMLAGLKHIEFEPSATSCLLFKSKIENCLTLFCNDRFKKICESLELHGVVFDTDLIVS